MNTSKFYFECHACHHTIATFQEWFDHGQICPKCGSNRVDTIYPKANFADLKNLIFSKEEPQSLWHYFDYLPLNKKENIVSKGEGVPPIERWSFIEEFAKKQYGIDCQVNVIRNEFSPATGTFKDKGATLAASVLTENGIKDYIVASTGNTATAFANYLATAGINLSVFIPQDAIAQNEAEVGAYGQRVFKVLGDYAKAKKVAKEYSQKYKIIMTGGNFDPLRVEAKKTMVYEWMRRMGKHPDVYIQALSGGTGPFAIEKAHKEMQGTGLFDKLPRFILSQPSGCDPMTQSWEKAKANGFPEGFEKEYTIIDNPVTLIPTLATGHPATYPAMAKLVQKSNGEILTFDENRAADVTRLVAYETGVKIGPASAIAFGGLLEAFKKGMIKQGESILINLGEGTLRATEYMQAMAYTTKEVHSVDECEKFDRAIYKETVWAPFL